jgi:hypothetical protein
MHCTELEGWREDLPKIHVGSTWYTIRNVQYDEAIGHQKEIKNDASSKSDKDWKGTNRKGTI